MTPEMAPDSVPSDPSENLRRARSSPGSDEGDEPTVTVIDWLLDADPAIRWQVMRDLTDAPPDEVAAERARVATEGWGAAAARAPGRRRPMGRRDVPAGLGRRVEAVLRRLDGHPLLARAPPRVRPRSRSSPQAQRAIAPRPRQRPLGVRTASLYFEGEVEPCINGVALANGAYFGQSVDGIVETCSAASSSDGGWNCWAEYGATVSSFHSTICALEGLLAWEQAGGSSDAVTAARRAGRGVPARAPAAPAASTGEIVDPRFTMSSFPTRWYYDVLRGLDYFRSTGPTGRSVRRRDRPAAGKRDADGRWPLENTHQGPTHFEIEAARAFRAGGSRCAPCGCCAGPTDSLRRRDQGIDLARSEMATVVMPGVANAAVRFLACS